MIPLGIPIELDRTRALLLDAFALRLLRQRFGIRENEITKIPILTLELVQQFVWAGLQRDDSRLTHEKVCLLITHWNFEEFKLPIVKALLRGFNVAYSPNE